MALFLAGVFVGWLLTNTIRIYSRRLSDGRNEVIIDWRHNRRVPDEDPNS